MSQKDKYGLVGRNIAYSFSRGYFAEKFAKQGIDAIYENFDIPEITDFLKVIETPGLRGLNVTIPYKESVIPYLDELSEVARAIGAVNTIEFRNGKTIGHNTDCIGFMESLKPLIQPHHDRALILGKGGAAKAVAYALEQLGIDYEFASRSGKLTFDDLTAEKIASSPIIINTTPLGTSPETDKFPPIPYDGVTDRHLVYDLIYNPEKTCFMQIAESYGAQTKNGYEMLGGQAEAAWAIWNQI